MKSLIIGTIVGAAALATPATAQQLYLQGEVGLDLYPGNETSGVGFDINPGATLGGRFGADFDVIRAELDLSISGSTVDVSIDAGSEDADYYHFAVQAGVYRDFADYFYAGGGAGIVYQELSAEILGVEVSTDTTDFIAHAELGLNFDINDAVAIVPHYRFTWLPGFELDDEVFQHSLRVGARFRL